MKIRRIGAQIALAAALALTLIAPARIAAQDGPAPATQIGDVTITREDFHARVRFVRWQYLQEIAKLHELTAGNLGLTAARVLTLVEGLRDADALGASVLAQMEDEALAREAAAALALAPTPGEIDALREGFFSLWTGVEVEALAEDADAQAFIDGWYASAQAASGLERDAIDAVFATEALWDTLYAVIAAQAPTEELNVQSRHILCGFDSAAPTEEQRASAQACIRAAQARLAGGEAFERVAADLSTDASSAARGGSLGWVPVSYLVDGYAAAAETATLDAVIGPVETEFGLHLIEVLARENRPLSESDLVAAQAELFAQWVAALRAEAAITRGPDWQTGIPTEPALSALSQDVLAAIERLEATD